MKLKIAWKMIFLVGLISMFMGLDFLFIRPTFVLLPEDSRFIQLSATQLQAYNNNLFIWIGFVFRSWGAFALSTGVLIMGIAAYGLRKREIWAYIVLALAGIPSIALFLFVNISLKSDFTIGIGLLLLLYLIALTLAFGDVFQKKKEANFAILH